MLIAAATKPYRPDDSEGTFVIDMSVDGLSTARTLPRAPNRLTACDVTANCLANPPTSSMTASTNTCEPDPTASSARRSIADSSNRKRPSSPRSRARVRTRAFAVQR